MNAVRSVALVGRPNVGKSRLFNRLVGRRLSIVHDQPGVTRDVIVSEVNDDFILMDTGGIGMHTKMTPDDISVATEEQVDFAIAAATVIVFVCDGLDGWTAVDVAVANKLRKTGKPIILLVNKMDLLVHEAKLSEFYGKGFGDPIPVSAEQGYNTEAVFNAIEAALGPRLEKTEEEKAVIERTEFAFFGRPNVGKSSLSNALLGRPRLIVSPTAGTTREAVKVDFDYKTPGGDIWPFSIVDTAGLRPKAKVDTPLEYFSTLRSENMIDQVDVGFLVIEAKVGITSHDKRLAGQILDAGRAFGVIVNKWDEALEAFDDQGVEGFDSREQFQEAFEEQIRKAFFFLPEFPILFVSAKTGKGVDPILKTARTLKQRQLQDLPTAKVNKVIADLLAHREPRLEKGKRFKVYYAVQVHHRPTTIRLFCNQEARLTDSYAKYLLVNFARAFDLSGCPVKLEMKSKPKKADRKRK